MSDQSIKPVEYRPIEGFPGYRVGDDGTVWSCIKQTGLGNGGGTRSYLSDEWTILKQTEMHRGYMTVALRRRTKRVHRLVLTAFVGPCPAGMEGTHFPDRDKKNNRLTNLRWATPKQNQADRLTHGTDARGEKHHCAVLNEQAVREIFELKSKGFSYKAIANKFGVDKATVKDVVAGRTWKHLGFAKMAQSR